MKIEVSNGEIIDKYTILQIKQVKITDILKLADINKELKVLEKAKKSIIVTLEMYASLLDVNLKLWEIEDEIRLCEKEQRFDDYFINLARQVYILNDQRAQIKYEINKFTNSKLVEQKSYK